MAAAAVAPTVASPPEQRVTLYGVSWETYERLLGDCEDRRVPRLTYDQGVLEIVSPTPEHEEGGYTLGLVVAVVAEELGTDFRGWGRPRTAVGSCGAVSRPTAASTSPTRGSLATST